MHSCTYNPVYSFFIKINSDSYYDDGKAVCLRSHDHILYDAARTHNRHMIM
jgi:hypothetical protein